MAKLYLFSVWNNDDALERKERGTYVRFFSQSLLDHGHRHCDVRFALGNRLITHLLAKGHTVIRV